MEGIFIFDGSNDLICKKLNEQMKEKLLDLAQKQGLLNHLLNINEIDNNIIMQIFSPLITSQRIMLCQFDNSYSSIQCDNDFTIVLEEYLGYLFLKAGNNSLEFMQKSIEIFISCVKHVCGPNVYLLKSDTHRTDLVTKLYDSWINLYLTKQTLLVEAVEQLLVNSEVKSKAIQGLRSIDKLKAESQKCHAIIFVEDKLLSLYSSKQSQPLSAADLVFTTIFINTILNDHPTPREVCSELLFLDGSLNNKYSGCIPIIFHVSRLYDNIMLVVLVEHTHLMISNNLFDIFFAVQKVKNLQSQGDIDKMKQSYEGMDFHIKHSLDLLKKFKTNSSDIEETIKIFAVKWEMLKKSYLEYFKTKARNVMLKIESNLPKLNDTLKELFNLIVIQNCKVNQGRDRVVEISNIVDEQLSNFKDFLTVKSHTNFSIASYLEEFPGLVHFIHVDRSIHRVTAPNIEPISENNLVNLQKKVWSMVEFSRQYLNKGHLNMMWKDIAFNYTYCMWFEDQNGLAIKPKIVPNLSLVSVKPQTHVGILSGDFYRRFIEISFPNTNSNKIKCYELYCIHLGLVTSTIVLEHCRRLAATINDVVGISKNSADFL